MTQRARNSGGHNHPYLDVEQVIERSDARVLNIDLHVRQEDVHPFVVVLVDDLEQLRANTYCVIVTQSSWYMLH
jgi:hypothetical protein